MIKLIKFSQNKYLKNRKKINKFFKNFVIFSLIIVLISFVFKNPKMEESSISSHEKIFVGNDLEGEILFNDNFNTDVFTTKILDAINGAKKSIHLAVFSINNEKIIGALKKKQEEGLDVKVVLPVTKVDKYEKYFKDSKIDVTISGQGWFFDNQENFMHHKFMIVDVGEDDQKLFFGSANLTVLQEVFDSSFFIYTQEDNIIDSFEKEFNLLFAGKRGTSKFKNKDFSSFEKEINYENGKFEIWFGPGVEQNSIKNRLLSLIEQAEKEIKVIGWRINDREILHALSKKAKDGISIKILLDDAYFWSDYSIGPDLLKLQDKYKNLVLENDSFNNIYITRFFKDRDNFVTYDFNPFLHRHSLIVDSKVLLTGTNNWSANGFFRNDESMIVTTVDWLVRDYERSFDGLFSKKNVQGIKYELVSREEILISGIPEGKTLNAFLYLEKSDPDKVGEICYEATLIRTKNTFSFPDRCVNERVKLYVSDLEGNLLLGEYIFS